VRVAVCVVGGAAEKIVRSQYEWLYHALTLLVVLVDARLLGASSALALALFLDCSSCGRLL